MLISSDIKYIGVNDHKVDLFEGQYVVPNGISYNSYAIVDDKIAIMDTGTNGSEQLVMLQNETSTTWTLGEKYRIFADVTGVYGTMPKMMARYTYAYQ